MDVALLRSQQARLSRVSFLAGHAVNTASLNFNTGKHG
jgi:hypothetical protein